jgi:hypothetical protein
MFFSCKMERSCGLGSPDSVGFGTHRISSSIDRVHPDQQDIGNLKELSFLAGTRKPVYGKDIYEPGGY